jgi:hypothetical protein
MINREEEIRQNIVVECADVIQNIFSLANKYGIVLSEICVAMHQQNAKWKGNIDNKRIY